MMSRMKAEEPQERWASSIQIDKAIGDNGRFLLTELLGRGGFGKVFAAVDTENGGKPVAIKTFGDERFEAIKALKRRKVVADLSNPFELQREYFTLLHMEKVPGFPTPIHQGTYDGEPYFVMERLGDSIAKVFKKVYDKHFSIKTILLLMDQLLERLRQLHGQGLIHGDLKPQNILLGYKSQTVYLIDFGLTTMYKDTVTGEHLPQRINEECTGTTRFMSINGHNGIQQSRRDDMESLAYLMGYFTSHGELPWEPLVKKDDPDGIQEIKEGTPVEVVFQGQPREFAIFLKEVRALGYEDEPEYERYINMFRTLGIILGVKYEDEEGRSHLDLSF